jgi:hypothetical protein
MGVHTHEYELWIANESYFFIDLLNKTHMSLQLEVPMRIYSGNTTFHMGYWQPILDTTLNTTNYNIKFL